MTVITHLTGAALHVWACSSLFVKAISEPNVNEIERTSEGAQMYLKNKRKLRRSLFALRMLAEKNRRGCDEDRSSEFKRAALFQAQTANNLCTLNQLTR
jgi:hypothetical protein